MRQPLSEIMVTSEKSGFMFVSYDDVKLIIPQQD